MATEEPILLSVKDGFAIITLNQPKKYNALDLQLYKRLAAMITAIDAREDVHSLILTGTGKFFSAGADIKSIRPEAVGDDSPRSLNLRRLGESNLELSRALYDHSKITIVALNGPAIGLSAAITGWFDFVYMMENAYLVTPFSSLSLAAEGGASLTFPRRMGIAKANEALLFGKKLSAPELLQNGYVNKIFPQSSDKVFMSSLMSYLSEQYADLDVEAAMITKDLIRKTLPDPSTANVREVFAGADRLASGKPQAHFAKIAAKQKRHKL